MEKDLLINLLINECHFSSHKGFKAIYENLHDTVITKHRQTYWAWDNVNKSAEWVLVGCPMALAHTSCPRSQAWAWPPFLGSGLWGMFSFQGVFLTSVPDTGGWFYPRNTLCPP